MNIKQWSGILGSFLLIIAVFMPVVSVPFVGNLNYFQNGEGDGVFILILAIFSLILIFIENYKALWITGLLSYMVMLFTFLNFRYEVAKLKNDVRTELGNNPFSELANMAIESVQLEWGFSLLIVGAALVLYSAGTKSIDTPIIIPELIKQVSDKAHIQFGNKALLESRDASLPSIELTMNQTIIIGRSKKANICLNNEYISGTHLSLTLDTNREVIVKDLNSSNGTYIFGKKLLSNIPMSLQKGEQLIIGSEEVVYTYV